MSESGYLLIGSITGVHGIRGMLRVWSYAESPSVFDPGCPIFLKREKGSQERYIIRSAAPRKRGVLLSLEGVSDRSEAESLVGAELFIEKSRLPELEEDTYYWDDLVGLSVVTMEGEFLGHITTIIPTGSNDVYVVRDGRRETMIPAIGSVVISVSLEDRTMQVSLPEGLD